MLPKFMVEEVIAREDGVSSPIDLGATAGGVVVLTLGITRIIEQESLDLAIWGSTDGETWGTQPVIAFPQKFYCGTYSLLLDLEDKPEIKFLRAQWKMNRWGRGDTTPLFGFYLFANECDHKLMSMAQA